jgi:hypothetical protein
MPGFPVRSLIQAFGSRLVNARPIENPEKEVSAERLNLSESLGTASNLIMPRASLIAEWSAVLGRAVVLHQEEAWNVSHSQAHPALQHLGDGAWRYTFAASYRDLDGVLQPVQLFAARCAPIRTGFGDPVYTCQLPVVTESYVEFVTFAASTPTDCRFWLEVF